MAEKFAINFKAVHVTPLNSALKPGRCDGPFRSANLGAQLAVDVCCCAQLFPGHRAPRDYCHRAGPAGWPPARSCTARQYPREYAAGHGQCAWANAL